MVLFKTVHCCFILLLTRHLTIRITWVAIVTVVIIIVVIIIIIAIINVFSPVTENICIRIHIWPQEGSPYEEAKVHSRIYVNNVVADGRQNLISI